jgi:phosphatidate phosphatase APP1
LTPSFVAGKLGASVTTSSGASGTPCNSRACGDAMTSVSVSGQTLTPGGTATLPSNPPPTFDCTFGNTGQQALSNTVVRVTVKGTNVSGSATVAQTQPGGSYTVHVALSSAPPTGTHTVEATVEPHPNESPVVHNTQTFTITFH